MKFCLLTLSGAPVERGDLAFFLTRATHLRDDRRRFQLSAEDFALLNPNTRTCPVFRTKADADLTRAIYRRVPVLVDERTGANPWGVSFLAMFHMSNDSGLFRTAAQLAAAGYRREGAEWVRGAERYVPLYEAKLFHQFNHRWATYAEPGTLTPGPSPASRGGSAGTLTPLPSLPRGGREGAQSLTPDPSPGEWEGLTGTLTPSPSPALRERGAEGGVRDLRRYDSSAEVRAQSVANRATPTKSEAMLWEALRDRRLQGLKFRRQFALGQFIADFYCPERGLVVEVDGGAHAEVGRAEHDQARDAWLAQRGIRTLRVPAQLVETDLRGALRLIAEAADPQSGSLTPSPSPALREGDTGSLTPSPSPAERERGAEGGVRDSTPAELADPAYAVTPRYWVPAEDVEQRSTRRGWTWSWQVAHRRIAGSTNERTLIVAVTPAYGAGDPDVLLTPRIEDPAHLAACEACLNSLVTDYAVRQKLGGTDLRVHYFQQFPILPPSAYRPDDLDFIVPRVLELTYTAWDLQPFARDLGYDGPPFPWDEDRRALLRAELDAYYASLYGLSRDELRYILDPADVYGPDFPGETFRVLKEGEIRRYGEYRTRRLVLEAWDRLGLGPRNREGRYEVGPSLTPQPSLPRGGREGARTLTPGPSPARRGRSAETLTPGPSPASRGRSAGTLTPGPSPASRERGAEGGVREPPGQQSLPGMPGAKQTRLGEEE